MTNTKNIDFGVCPQCGARLERRLGDRLVCTSSECDYSAELYGESSRSWLTALHQDKALWQKGYFDDFPTPVSHEYHRMLNMAGRGQVFCMVYQIKDVGEMLLKFPVLCAAALLKDFEITKLLVEKQPSLGDWERVCSQLVKKSGGEYVYDLPQSLRNILINIKAMYSDTLFVKKRNEYIGHGAMGFEDNEDYRVYCENLLRAIAKHLDDTHDDYAQIGLFIGDQELRGWRKAELMESNSSPSVVIGGQSVELYPFIIRLENGVYFFDYLDGSKRTKPSYGLNYVKGGARRKFDAPYFVEVYERAGYVYDPGYTVEDAVSDIEAEKALATLSEAANFVKPEKIISWIRDNVVEECKGGVHLLTMERGMGKTALAYALADGTVRLSGVKVCAYYCSQSQLRGLDSFTNGVMNSIIGELVETKTGEFKRLELSAENKQKNMISVLSYFNSIYSRRGEGEKLLLILDGLDEIPANCTEAFKFIPDSADMPENVYILLTARNPEKESLAPHAVSALSKLNVGSQYVVAPESEENIATLKKYLAGSEIVRTESGRRAPSADETDRLLSLSGNTFLNLRVYAKLVEGGYAVEELPELSSEQLFERYLEEIQAVYGDKLYDEALKTLLIIATAQEPLTLQELAYLCGYEGVNLALLAFIKDFGALVKAVRNTHRGTQLAIASERYKEYVERTFAVELAWLTAELADVLLGEDPSNYDEKNFGEKVPDGLLYLAAHISHYINRYAAVQFKEQAAEEKLWDKVEGFGLAVYGMQDYRLLRKIGCYNSAEQLLGDEADENDVTRLRMNRGLTYQRLTRYEEALADYDKAIEIMERLWIEGKLHDENDIAKARMNRANTYQILARYDQALADYDKAIEIMERLWMEGKLHDENDIAMVYMNRTVTYQRLARYEEALADQDRAIEIMERLWEHGKLHDENYIAAARMNRANTYQRLTRYDQALADYDKAIEIMERLWEHGKLHDEDDIATALMNRANTYQRLTRYDQALADYDKAIEIMERLWEHGKLHDENDIAMVRMNRANTYQRLTRYEEALADYDHAIEIRERLWMEGKLHDENYIAARMNRAGTYHYLTRYDEALADCDKAIEIMERLWEHGKLHDEDDIATALMNRANTYQSLTRYEEALADDDKAIEIRERLWEHGKLHDENDIADVRMNRANTYQRLTRYTEALADYDKAIEIRERLWEHGKLHDENDIATALINRAVTYQRLTRYDQALADYDKAIEIRERLWEHGKLHDENDIAMVRMNRANTYQRLTRYEEALADYDHAIEIRERLWKQGKLKDKNDVAKVQSVRESVEKIIEAKAMKKDTKAMKKDTEAAIKGLLIITVILFLIFVATITAFIVFFGKITGFVSALINTGTVVTCIVSVIGLIVLIAVEFLIWLLFGRLCTRKLKKYRDVDEAAD